MLGRITFDTSQSFYEVFIAPWLNIFCISMGVFAASLFAYISAVFLVGETKIDRERKMYVRLAKRFMIGTMITGVLVFITASVSGHNLMKQFSHSVTSIVTLIFVAILCPVIWLFLNKEKNKTVYLRIGVSLQVTLVLIGWFYIQFPVLIKLNDGTSLTFLNTQAPYATLYQLLIALIVGLIVIIPGFVYLFRVFKIKSNE